MLIFGTGGTLRAHATYGLPTQVTWKASHTIHVGGVSSFGYAGTIAHSMLIFTSVEGVQDSGEAFTSRPRGAEASGGEVSAKC